MAIFVTNDPLVVVGAERLRPYGSFWVIIGVEEGIIYYENLKLQMEIVKPLPNSYFMRKAAGDRQIIEKYTWEIADQIGLVHHRIIRVVVK